MIISNKNKFIYFAVGKTGTTSIEKCLRHLHDDKRRTKHAGPGCVDADKMSKYFTFCFVRNPWSRLVSMYKQFQKGLSLKNNSRQKHYIMSNKYNFIEYIKKLDESFFQEHLQSKYYLYNGEPLNFIGKFENIKEDFDIVCSLIKIKRVDLVHRNKSVYESNREHYTEYYDDEVREIVANEWAEDIEYFNYKFDEDK